MILTHQQDNHIYLVFQDFEDNTDEILKEVEQFSKKASQIVKEILNKNFFSQSLKRQKNYVNSISTYIDDIFEDENQYFFHMYILPKDLNITYDESEAQKNDTIKKIEELSLNIFKLYNSLLEEKYQNKIIELFENYSGSNFLQLEAKFYIDKLEKLYSVLINHKINHRNKIVCSDKKVGIEINDLNMIEGNPLKNYQFIKVKYQKDLIRFVYSTIKFLEKNRLHIFETKCPLEYEILSKIIHKFSNLLIKISDKKNIVDDKISKSSLKKYLNNYKNKKELKENKNIFKLVESIFYTQLKKDNQLFTSIDLTKVFEKIVEKKLGDYVGNLLIGDETKKYIYNAIDNTIDHGLSNTNHLLAPDCLSQYPDFLIKGSHQSENIFHIIDAKYKLNNKLPNEGDTRQILIYALLFNKMFSQNLQKQENIKKIIIFASKSNININENYNLSINESPLNINELAQECEYFEYQDNLFNSKILFVGIPLLNT